MGTEQAFCTFRWEDGWGPHTCHLPHPHLTDHRCPCDSTTADRPTVQPADRRDPDGRSAPHPHT